MAKAREGVIQQGVSDLARDIPGVLLHVAGLASFEAEVAEA